MATARGSWSTRSAAAVAAVAAAAVAWLAWQELWAHGGGRQLEWRDLTDRTLAEPQRSELRVFSSREDLLRHLRQGGSSATVPGELDFDRADAVLVAAGPRSSSRYRLEVVELVEERRRIIVSVRERAPSLAEPGAARLTFPFRLIAIERRGKEVTLDWRGRP